jgi:predicted Zn-dependent peptidase
MVHRFTRIPSKLATIVITFDAGSRSEGDGEGREYSSGIAHMLEHCIFTGTKNLTSVDINRKLAYYGASVNAWTSHEAVAYYATVPVDNIQDVVSILSEMVFESTLLYILTDICESKNFFTSVMFEINILLCTQNV